jgi:hypothetical protein
VAWKYLGAFGARHSEVRDRAPGRRRRVDDILFDVLAEVVDRTFDCSDLAMRRYKAYSMRRNIYEVSRSGKMIH